MPEGTGLGLTISHKLVTLMEGTLQATSVYGQGSTFWFDLTLPEAEARKPEADSDDRIMLGVVGPKRKIIVVDDKADNRQFLDDALTPLGFTVQLAANGLECVQQVSANKPDAILMDLRMPVLDGLAATKQLRGLPQMDDLVIIGVSASSFDHNRTECLDAGANGFLTKPFRISNLVQLLCEHLQLEIVYDETDSVGLTPQESRTSSSMAIPTADVIEELHILAVSGNIAQVLQQVQALEQSNPTFHEFVTRVRSLCEQFQVKKLRTFLNNLKQQDP